MKTRIRINSKPKGPFAIRQPADANPSRPVRQHSGDRRAEPGPWILREFPDEHAFVFGQGGEFIANITTASSTANARLIAAAPDLLEAAQLLEAAELSRQDCDECEDEGEPETCFKCFPKFDDARIKRRLAIAAAVGDRPDAAQPPIQREP